MIYQTYEFHHSRGQGACVSAWPYSVLLSIDQRSKRYGNMIKKGYNTKIVNLITLRIGGAVLGCGHIFGIVKFLITIKSASLLLSIGLTNWIMMSPRPRPSL